ncbi:MAG TPA: nuclease [Acidobacteriaceae bacterium]|nr:nuclease [Acidobacteriaceae bacterium]
MTIRGYTTGMRILPGVMRAAAILMLLPAMFVQQGFAWGHDGHSMIDQVAGKTLPADVPEFLRSYGALDALYFYGPVPDQQWRSYAVPELNAAKEADHELNLEWAELAGPFPKRRYDYIRQLQAAQPKHPELTMTPEKMGMLPYAVDEDYEALQAAMYEYRYLQNGGKDTRPVEAQIVYLAGILGHFVADGSQPMHASIQYNGWTGPNPNGYPTDKKIHARFESDFVHANITEVDFSGLVPAKPQVIQDVFTDFMQYLRHSNSLIEKTYQLDKAGGFRGAGAPEGKAFVDERLAAGATKLRDLIYTAWIRSADPVPAYHGN